MLSIALIAALSLVPGALAAPADSMVATPGGLMPAANVKAVPVGGGAIHVGSDVHIVDADGNVVEIVTLSKRTIGQRVKRFVSGWTAYASWFNTESAPINSFVTEWPVPSLPTTWTAQTLYYFNSIESSNSILQPVLQYGPSPAGGGEYWTVASWYVFNDNTQSMFTPLVNVTVGQTLTGVISLTGSSGSNYNYQSSFNGIAGTFLSVSNIEELVTATETLEAYDIVESGNYPSNPTVFSNATVILQSGSPGSITWSTTSDPADNINMVVDTDGPTNAKFTITY